MDDVDVVMLVSDESSCELPPVQLIGTCAEARSEENVEPAPCIDLTVRNSSTPPLLSPTVNSRILYHCTERQEDGNGDGGNGENRSDYEELPDSDRAFDMMLSTAATATTASTTFTNTNNNFTSTQCVRRQDRETHAQDKRARVALHRAHRPTECMQHMVVEVSEELQCSWLTSDVQRELGAAGVTLTTPTHPAPPELITFLRRVPQLPEERSGRGVLVANEEKATALVSRRHLSRYAAHVAQQHALTLTLLIFLPLDYFKKDRAGRGREPRVSEVELEMALADLAVCADADAAVVRTPAELALFLLHYTKAIAEQPYKSRKQVTDERVDVYVRADSRQCITVDSDGRGLSQLWQQMLAVLPQSSLETARAIRQRYSTPRLLAQECSSAEGRARVAETGVVRAAGADARARALGPEFARRLATLFTADCGDTLLV